MAIKLLRLVSMFSKPHDNVWLYTHPLTAAMFQGQSVGMPDSLYSVRQHLFLSCPIDFRLTIGDPQ